MRGQDVKAILEKLYPVDLAYEWDNVGLQVGSFNTEIDNILLTLDLTKEVIEEAIIFNIDLIIVHHPLIFTPIKNINIDTYKGNLIKELIKNDISLYAAHTNFDISNNGMNKILADMLKLKNQKVLDYTTETEGLGRIGEIKESSMDNAISFIKKTFQVNNARFIGDMNSKVNKIAISGGSGSSNIYNAKEMGADLFITGDLSYHVAHDILAINLNALDIGHNIEKHFVNELKNTLKEEGIKSNIYISTIDTEPYKFV